MLTYWIRNFRWMHFIGVWHVPFESVKTCTEPLQQQQGQATIIFACKLFRFEFMFRCIRFLSKIDCYIWWQYSKVACFSWNASDLIKCNQQDNCRHCNLLKIILEQVCNHRVFISRLEIEPTKKIVGKIYRLQSIRVWGSFHLGIIGTIHIIHNITKEKPFHFEQVHEVKTLYSRTCSTASSMKWLLMKMSMKNSMDWIAPKPKGQTNRVLRS